GWAAPGTLSLHDNWAQENPLSGPKGLVPEGLLLASFGEWTGGLGSKGKYFDERDSAEWEKFAGSVILILADGLIDLGAVLEIREHFDLTVENIHDLEGANRGEIESIRGVHDTIVGS